MNIQWQNQVILVTGASGGIGHAVAKAFDEKGAHLILTGRDELKLKQLQQSLKHQHTIVAAAEDAKSFMQRESQKDQKQQSNKSTQTLLRRQEQEKNKREK